MRVSLATQTPQTTPANGLTHPMTPFPAHSVRFVPLARGLTHQAFRSSCLAPPAGLSPYPSSYSPPRGGEWPASVAIVPLPVLLSFSAPQPQLLSSAPYRLSPPHFPASPLPLLSRPDSLPPRCPGATSDAAQNNAVHKQEHHPCVGMVLYKESLGLHAISDQNPDRAPH